MSRTGAMSRNFALAPLRLVAVVLWIILMPSLFIVMRALRIPAYRRLPHLFHAGMRKIFSIHVQTEGSATQRAPALYVSNHISYLDIIVLGDLRAFFIAKSEVAAWPVFGQLARFQNTLFFETHRPHKAT